MAFKLNLLTKIFKNLQLFGTLFKFNFLLRYFIKCSGDYDINQTTLIPIIPNLSEFQANPIKAISIIKIDNIIEIIKETESLDYEKIYL